MITDGIFMKAEKKKQKVLKKELPAFRGRGEKTRTSDLHVPNVARCQLCYTPIFPAQK